MNQFYLLFRELHDLKRLKSGAFSDFMTRHKD